jgi:hypothetical protein
MKASQLATQLLGIVIEHTDSKAIWQERDLTDEQRSEIGAALTKFIRADFRDWKANLRKKIAEGLTS